MNPFLPLRSFIDENHGYKYNAFISHIFTPTWDMACFRHMAFHLPSMKLRKAHRILLNDVPSKGSGFLYIKMIKPVIPLRCIKATPNINCAK